MLSKKSFTIATTFFVVFLVGHPYASGNSCDNNGFHPEEKGQYLQHHVIDAMTTETVSLCRIMCYLQESCTSYNYQPSTGSCELSDSDEIKHPKDLIPSHSDHVYVKRENPCHKNPCPEYQVCKPNFKERSRGCSCQHDYASPTCKDIDECATGQHDCSPNADCSNTIGSHNCECKDGYHGNGKTCKVSVSCKELLSAGYRDDGVYTINPDGQGSFPVYCDMTTDGGGWTVFQRNRKDSPTSFNHNWQEYKTGLGKVTGEFWLGLDKIYRLTKAQAATLRVELEDDQGKKGYAVYSSFSVADESDFYRLNVSGFSGTAGDSIAGTAVNRDWINNKMNFSTPDKDNDLFTGGSCAFERNAGWWYNWCSNSDLNGAMTWWTFNKTLMNTEMKLK